MATRKKKPTPETIVMRKICDYLADRNYVFWRANNMPVYEPRKKIFHAMPKYSMKGVADIQVILYGQSIFVEVKAPQGVQSKDQKKFQELVTKAGAKYGIVRSVNDLAILGL